MSRTSGRTFDAEIVIRGAYEQAVCVRLVVGREVVQRGMNLAT
jgi:hypothetical protein